MNGPQLKEAIFKLMWQMDTTPDLNEVVRLQFEIEALYLHLVNLTGASQAALEATIEKEYPEWVRKLKD